MAELNALPVHLKEPVFPWRRLTHATGGPLLIAMAALQVIRSGMNGFGNAADSEAADSEHHKPKQPADQGWIWRDVEHGRATPPSSTCVHDAEQNQRADECLKGSVSVRIPPAPLNPVPRFKARVLVHLRPSVLDPAGEATRSAAARLGIEGLQRLRIGKAVEMELEAPDEQEARRRLELLSDRLLANPVIEDWSLELDKP